MIRFLDDFRRQAEPAGHEDAAAPMRRSASPTREPATSFRPTFPPVRRFTVVDCQLALAHSAHGDDLTHGVNLLELQLAGARAVRDGDEVRARAYQRAIERRLAEAHRDLPGGEAA
jgi:hypothetical protein